MKVCTILGQTYITGKRVADESIYNITANLYNWNTDLV